MLDLNELVSLLFEHRWFPVLVILIGALVRLVKSDIALPFAVPPRLRSWLALGLGGVLGVLQSLAAGGPLWRSALEGLAAGIAAIAAHDTVIESPRKGREFLGSAPGSDDSQRHDSGQGPGAGAVVGLILAVGITVAFTASGCRTSERKAPACSAEVITATPHPAIEESLRSAHSHLKG